MRVGRIYKITNLVNGKVYIGQTIRTLKQRWWAHCCKLSKTHGGCPILHRAIEKYGKENFKMEEIEQVDPTVLDEREIYWIRFYDSTNREKGYNLSTGGMSGATREFALTKEQEEEVIKLKLEGKSSEELSRMYGIDKGTVKNIFTRHGLEMPNRKALENKVDQNEFFDYVTEGTHNINDVCKQFKICKTSAYHLFKRLNINPQVLKKKPGTISNAEKNASLLVQKYNEGYNIKQLVKMFSSPKKYVSKVLKTAGVEIKRNRKPLIKYNNSKSVRTLTDNAEG